MARDKKERNQAMASKKEDESTLSFTKGECFEKKSSFEDKQQLRAEEIEAIQKAVEILSDPDAMKGTKHLSLMQTSSSFAQIRGASVADSAGIRLKVKEFFEQRARKLHSKNLELLAQKMAADPFA